MNKFKKCANWCLEKLEDLLAPEDLRIQKLLSLEPSDLRALLPQSPVNTKNMFVLFDYGNKIVKLVVKSIKYKNNSNLKKRLAIYLHEEIVDLSSEISLFHGAPPILVPMPMSKNEKSKKGFNQCEELCKEIQKLDPSLEIYYDLLKKIRETKRQTELTREERLTNVRDSMTVPPEKTKIVEGRVVIVLDDVYTTLATFSEARRALLEAGARSVHGLFIAH